MVVLYLIVRDLIALVWLLARSRRSNDLDRPQSDPLIMDAAEKHS